MIVDTSALLAILFAEPDAERYARAIAETEGCKMSAATFVEAGIVVDTQTDAAGSRHLDAFLRRAGISSNRSAKSRRMWRAKPTSISARAGIPPD